MPPVKNSSAYTAKAASITPKVDRLWVVTGEIAEDVADEGDDSLGWASIFYI